MPAILNTIDMERRSKPNCLALSCFSSRHILYTAACLFTARTAELLLSLLANCSKHLVIYIYRERKRLNGS